jgi:hypothetical protein
VYVQNTALVTAVRGFYPVSDNFTVTGRAGAVFVHTSLDRQSAYADDTYTGKDNQVHATFGIGGMYKLTNKLNLTADLNWYPKITKTNDNATDTNARMVSRSNFVSDSLNFCIRRFPLRIRPSRR